ncbi:MAG: flagellar biosynthetic protein FliO [Treponema sp.]|nr:flagellar biosynthetic protein FliO [Treponema sp.]
MNLKKIIASFFLLGIIVIPLAAQKINEENTQVSENSSTKFDENSTNYFSSSQNLEGVEENQNRRNPSTGWLFFRMILILIIVCALIYGVFWFLKHKTKIVKSDDPYLRRAAYINIAPNKTIEIITLIDKAYLIGVTDDNITLLGQIDDKELIQAMNVTSDQRQNVKNPVNFSEILEFFTKKNKKASTFTSIEENIDNLIQNSSESTEGPESKKSKNKKKEE